MNQCLTVPELGTILAVWAHPDDETYLAGGVMAAAAANGQRVICVSATAGEYGTDDPETWPPDRLGRVRRWEAAAAMAVLGVRDHRWLDYSDGTLRDLDPAEPVARLADLIDVAGPDSILTFGPDGITYHPDHIAVGAWVRAAWERVGRRGRLLRSTFTDEHMRTWSARYEQWNVFMTDERPTGMASADLAVRLRLRGPALDQKMAALLAMHTQTAAAHADLGTDVYRDLNDEECFAYV